MRISDWSSDVCSSDLHINTNSDSEVLLNVFANELQLAANGGSLDEDAIFAAVSSVHRRAKGAYAVIAQIASYGLVAFRDPYGIRQIGRASCRERVCQYV